MRSHRNRGLFSNYYLDELLPKEEEFKVPISEVKAAFEKVKGIWDRSRFEAINEDQLRKHFLDKVLDYLGWVVDVNAPVPTGEWSKRPDYALFQNAEYLKAAQKGKKEDYFKKVACVTEAKRLGRHLDKRLKTESDPFEVQIPSMQISKYLWLTGVKWGILTDGKYWRLYERESSKRLDIFYEVDLEALIESGSVEGFRYFYLLFHKEAFPEFIEKVYTGSVDYAEEVGGQLKENIYQGLKTLTQGFVKTSGNSLSEEHLKEIHDNSLILLYRLLFILYAEHRDLLPLGVNRLYTESYSLDAFKKEVASRLDKNEPVAASTFGYWNKLKELFEIINKGNRELGVPPYNGGLFDPDKHHFLEKHRVGDSYVAKAIDLLSRSRDKAYIDYGSLEIRHLGSIYEGLLEYKLKIADQDLVPIKDKGKEIFVSLAEAKKQKKTIREDEEVKAGEIYLVTDKGERKASGSYYTPEYIVKYIVENTIGPLVEERQKKVSENTEKLKKRIKDSRGASREFHEKELKKAEGSLIDEILCLKILDPAMGSGHFLVEATDFLARELLKVLSGEPLEVHSKEMVISESSVPYGLKETEDEDIRWARREVVERCIFGVDLNPMAVELAKLSLWLYTVAKNRPLNFLDHHLRVGNSLIGAGIDDLASLPEFKKKKAEGGPVQLGLFESIFKEKVKILLGAFAQIEMLPSDTVEQIREKEELYQNFRKIVSRFQEVADAWISIYFGNDLDFANYQKLQNRLRSTDEEWGILSLEPWFKKAKEISSEKGFFHWELEFPEVFFEGHQRKGNPGFDAVIGNPPYVGFHGFEDQKVYLRERYYSCSGKFDIYIPFLERAIDLVKKHCLTMFICPSGFMKRDHGVKLREFITKSAFLRNMHDFEHRQIFVGAMNYVCIPCLEKIAIGSGSIQSVITFGEDPQLPSAEILVDVLPSGGEPWNFSATSIDIIKQVSKYPIVYLKEISSAIAEGVVTGCNDVFLLEASNPLKAELINEKFVKPALRGESVNRYSCDWDETHLIYPYIESKGHTIVVDEETLKNGARNLYNYLVSQNSKLINRDYFKKSGKLWFELWNQRSIYHHQGIKLIIQENSIDNEVLLDESGFFYLDTCCGISIDPSTKLAYPYCLSLLNSYLLSFIFKKITVPKAGGHFIHKPMYLSRLPIRRISFVTLEGEREQLTEEAKNHFKRYLETGKPTTILYYIESRLMKDHKPDAELVNKHNSDRFNKNWQIPEGALWEQSDVVHDILVFLAEQMIEMNKENQKEVKGYLKWLESQLKIHADKEGNTGIEALTGKTQIKNYLGDYQKREEYLPFEGFWKILEKNKMRIQSNLKSRELYENIRSEYEKSLSKLLPLKEKLRKTDWLIDQIVYKLYGLTEEEMKIVEGQGVMGS